MGSETVEDEFVAGSLDLAGITTLGSLAQAVSRARHCAPRAARRP
jgi:hypothetical protein